MAENPMLKFVKIPRLMPQKREASDRAHDFGEIYAEFSEDKAAEQASRCSQCGVPYCQTHCPLHNNIPDWLRLTAEGGFERPMTSARPPIHSLRFAVVFVRRIACAKAIASSNSRAMKR